MKNKQAFTLIELLVVVLIVGILAAVAVPQYQKAALRSRNVELKQLVKAVTDAQQVYYLANGKYAANFNELDVDLPLTPATTTAGGGVGACNTTIQGTDSVRWGKDFYVVLNSTFADMHDVTVAAYWNELPYACAGFGQYAIQGSTQIITCREMKNKNRYKAGAGAFCEKLENANLVFENSTWRTYWLP